MDDLENLDLEHEAPASPADASWDASFDAVFASMPLGLMVLDEAGRVTRVNPAAVVIAGGGPSDPLQSGPRVGLGLQTCAGGSARVWVRG